MPIFDAFDSETVRRRLHAFLARQVGAGVEIGPLKRFTVGFSWVTYGFSAQWRDGAETMAREFRVPVVVEVILEKVTNIAMGTEIDNIAEFEEIDCRHPQGRTGLELAGLLD